MNPTARVLIVDDEMPIRRLLQNTLARAGYATEEARGAGEALDLVKIARPDVVLLDLGLPDRNGMELVPLIRQNSDAAVIVVSAREATEEKVAALDLGAADYLTKPFDTEELLARIRLAIRNRLAADGAHALVRAGDVTIDLVERRVLKGEAEVHLTPKEYGVLTELARFPGRAITHQKLLTTVWPNDEDRCIDYLRVIIRHIRRKLESDPAQPCLILNEPGVGYRLGS